MISLAPYGCVKKRVFLSFLSSIKHFSHSNAICVGIEAVLWSELVRTSSRMDSMLWPRLLAVAERAWHKSSWEQPINMETSQDGQTAINNTVLSEDWARFAHLVGHKELRRLDAQGVDYYLPRPGARFVESMFITG